MSEEKDYKMGEENGYKQNGYKQKILDFINNNAKLQDDEGEKCLCISGKWGVGKTFIWKEVENEINKDKQNNDPKDDFCLCNHMQKLIKILINCLCFLYKYICCKKDESKESTKQIVYISLFGKEHYKEIIEEIVMKLNSRNKLVKLTESFEKINPKISLLGLGIDIAALLSLFEKKDFENIIICFDDIERKSSKISMKDFLGLVFQLKEDRKCRVVLILNEELLEEEDVKQFSLYKEKCIDSYLKIESREEVIEGILKRIIQDNDIERYILELDGKPVYKIENLREVKKIAECANYFNQEIFSHYKNNKDVDVMIKDTMRCIVDYYSNNDQDNHLKYLLDDYMNNAGSLSNIMKADFKDGIDNTLREKEIHRIHSKLNGCLYKALNCSNKSYVQRYKESLMVLGVYLDKYGRYDELFRDNIICGIGYSSREIALNCHNGDYGILHFIGLAYDFLRQDDKDEECIKVLKRIFEIFDSYHRDLLLLLTEGYLELEKLLPKNGLERLIESYPKSKEELPNKPKEQEQTTIKSSHKQDEKQGISNYPDFCDKLKDINELDEAKLNELFSRDIIIYFWERYKKESDSKIYDKIEKIYQNNKNLK